MTVVDKLPEKVDIAPSAATNGHGSIVQILGDKPAKATGNQLKLLPQLMFMNIIVSKKAFLFGIADYFLYLCRPNMK